MTVCKTHCIEFVECRDGIETWKCRWCSTEIQQYLDCNGGG